MTRRHLAVASALLMTAGWLPAGAESVSGLPADLEQGAPTAQARADAEPLLTAHAPATDCLTPFLLAAARRGPLPATMVMAQPPELPGERVWTAGSGLFRIHYATRSISRHALPGNGDELRYLESVDEALDSAYRLLVDELGFQAPVGAPFIEVYLADTSPGVAGYVVPSLGTASPQEERRSGFLVLHHDLEDPGPVAAHQLAHLVQLGYSHREPVWWHEASAAWVGVLAAGDASGEAHHLQSLLSTPERGLATEDPERMRGALLLPAYLSLDEASPAAVRTIWEKCGALAGDNLLDAIERVSEATGRGSLEDLLRAFYASWVTDTAGRARLMASLGVTLPYPTLSIHEDSYPAAGVPAGGSIAPLGASFLHFTSRPQEPGGLLLSVLGSPETPWDVLLLVRATARDPFAAVPVEVDDSGQARVRFPWSGISDSLLVVVNAERGPEPGRLSFWARHEPTIPFDLLDFRANPGADGVAIQWTTDSEADLYGWNVYRSSRSGGGFQRLNGFLIPAAGTDQDPATYTFLDGNAAGRKAYYYLEAITVDGFLESTHVIGAYPTGTRR